jgi:hypothetical protein
MTAPPAPIDHLPAGRSVCSIRVGQSYQRTRLLAAAAVASIQIDAIDCDALSRPRQTAANGVASERHPQSEENMACHCTKSLLTRITMKMKQNNT